MSIPSLREILVEEDEDVSFSSPVGIIMPRTFSLNPGAGPGFRRLSCFLIFTGSTGVMSEANVVLQVSNKEVSFLQAFSPINQNIIHIFKDLMLVIIKTHQVNV